MRLLLVEDSRRLTETLLAGLRRSGYSIDAAADGEAGLRLARLHSYDVLILDLMLPKIDGLAVVRELRRDNNPVHIIILTAKQAIVDRVEGLSAGADDYLPKPFAFDELLARVQALGRRKYGAKNPLVEVGELQVNFPARTVSRVCNGRVEDVPLTAREFALLEFLLLRKGNVVTRQQIEEALYDERTELLSSNVVDSAICTLRRKLDAPGRPSLIQTRRGLGYVLSLENHCAGTADP